LRATELVLSAPASSCIEFKRSAKAAKTFKIDADKLDNIRTRFFNAFSPQAIPACLLTRPRKLTNFLKQRTVGLEALDKKVDAAKEIWQRAGPSCKTDAVSIHIMSKLKQ
jgi:hypothetical protein